MGWSELGKTIIKQVPLLGSLLGGKAGGVVGQLIASVFGVENEPDTILELIKADPDAFVKLKQLESDHKLELQRLSIREEELRLTDVQSARMREVEVTKATGKKDVDISLIAYLVIGGFFTLLGLMIFKQLPEGSSEAIFILFGALASGFGAVIQYFFGSSKGSKDKNIMMANNSKGKLR